MMDREPTAIIQPSDPEKQILDDLCTPEQVEALEKDAKKGWKAIPKQQQINISLAIITHRILLVGTLEARIETLEDKVKELSESSGKVPEHSHPPPLSLARFGPGETNYGRGWR